MLRVPYNHRNVGHGVSGLFRSLSNVIRPIFSTAKSTFCPLASKVGSALKKEGAQILSDTANSLLSNEPVINSVNKSIKKSKKRIKRKIKKTLKGQGKQRKKKKKKIYFGGRKKKGGKKISGKGKRVGKGGKKGGRKKKGGKKRRKIKKKKSIFDSYTF